MCKKVTDCAADFGVHSALDSPVYYFDAFLLPFTAPLAATMITNSYFRALKALTLSVETSSNFAVDEGERIGLWQRLVCV